MIVLVLAVGSLCTTAALVHRRRSRASDPVVGHGSASRSSGSWLSLPEAPRPTTTDDDWILEAFAPEEITELRHIDVEVCDCFARDHQALVLARVPGSRRDRRIRTMGWIDGRLNLVLGDGTALELDGVARPTAVWLGYCHDQFGLVLETINTTGTAWAARLASFGWATPVRASRLRVS